MADKILYEKKDEVAWITLNRPEVRNAVDHDMHERLCEIWADFRDDRQLRVAVLSGAGGHFTGGADLKTHAPMWQDIGPMVGRERIEDGLSGITRGPLSRIYKPIIAEIDGWCVGHGIEMIMACDIRVASSRARFGEFQVRKGMHHADGGLSRLINTCGVGFTMEFLMTGAEISAQHAFNANMVNYVVPPEALRAKTEQVVQNILNCDRAAVESAKETILELIGRTLHDQLRVEAMWGYALCGGNPTIRGLMSQFFDEQRQNKGG
ncbi:MAG: enoyl-CoA hydratase/isomerase family protein [Pigmentiphaga sp.]|nr:enoyl-CoA hydratase/isomerase family protein [Pigmentiphaga sp.]